MRRKITMLAAAVGGLLAASTVSQAKAAGYLFTDIDVPGSLPGSTGFSTNLGINNLGQIVGTYNDNQGHSDGFLYSGGKYVTIDAPGATDTYLYGINDAGHILGASFDLATGKDYVFIDDHGSFKNIVDISNPSEFFFSPTAINNKDEIFAYLGGDGYGILDAQVVITSLDLSGASGNAFPSGFNDLGQLTGTVCDDNVCNGFIDTNASFAEFTVPDAAGYTAGGGINDQGEVAGVYFDNVGVRGFLYANGHFTTIDDPNASLEMGGTDPTAINNSGQIAGFYYDAEGAFHSFLADPVPEASTWMMMLAGLIGLGLVGRGRRGALFKGLG
jgi:probable HAF family extracellular repeat protein